MLLLLQVMQISIYCYYIYAISLVKNPVTNQYPWLRSPPAVILEPTKIKSDTVSTVLGPITAWQIGGSSDRFPLLGLQNHCGR